MKNHLSNSGKIIIKMLKITLILLLVLSLSGVFVYFRRDYLIKIALAGAMEKALGARVSMEKFDVDFKSESINVSGLKVYNPEPFEKEGILLNISSASVTLDVDALKNRNLHIPSVSLIIEKIVVVENEDGKLNVESFKASEAENKPEEQEVKEEIDGKNNLLSTLVIDEVFLSVNEVVHKKYDKEEKANIKVYSDIGLKNKNYKNVRGPGALITSAIAHALKKTAIKSGVIYGVAATTGVGLVPAVAGSLFVGNSSSDKVFSESFLNVYSAAIGAIKEMGGEVQDRDKKTGKIKAKSSDCAVKIHIIENENKEIIVKVSAKKLMMIKPKVAGGILHEIERVLENKKEEKQNN